MLIIDSETTIQTAAIPESHKTLLSKRWLALAAFDNFEPDAEGYLVYLVPEETHQTLTALGLDYNLATMGFDSATFNTEVHCYELIAITNNSFAWHFIIPESDLFTATKLNWLAVLLEENRDDVNEKHP